MSESKFLKYQDTSGTGIIDACEEIIEVKDPACEDCRCIANGAAIAPNWHFLKGGESFLNGKNCLYQVVIETEYTTTIDKSYLEQAKLTDAAAMTAMAVRYEKYADQAVEALLDNNNKEVNYTTRQTIKNALESTDYYLAPRSKSRLRLLYSVPFNVICGMINAAAEDAEPDPEIEAAAKDATAPAAGDVEVTYTIQDFKTKLILVRKALWLYGLYLKRGIAKDGEALYFEEDETPFLLSDYGDMGVLAGAKKSNLMAKILPQLDEFLNDKGYNIRGVAGSPKIFGDTVEKVTLTFDKEYVLKKLLIYTVECGEKPIEFPGPVGGKLKPLKDKSAWSDSTAMAYLTRLEDMVRDLTAREPKPWLQFVKEYTHPQVHTITNRGWENTTPDPNDKVGKALEMASCVAEALQDELKQLGQDIFDPDFNISDVIAEKLQEEVCDEDPRSIEKQKLRLGVLWSEAEGGATKEEIKAAALAQAFETLEQDDTVFNDLCALILKNSGNDRQKLIEGLFRLKLCGLADMTKDAITCLMGGLTLEETLSSITEAAFRAMGVEDFGQLFVGLPAETQAELDALVKKKFENGEFFKEGTSGQGLSDSIAGKSDYSKPWEATDDVTSFDERRTILQQLDVGTAAKEQLSPPTVLEAYIMAIMELFSGKMFELIEELNKLPGAPLFATALATIDCPCVPLLEPSAFEWIKDQELPLCRDKRDIVYPKWQNPFKWIPRGTDLLDALFVAVKYAIDEAFHHVLVALFTKICEIIGGAACGIYGAVGAMAASTGDRKGIINAIRDSICGEDASDEQIDDALVGMFTALGLGASALANTQQVTDFAEDIGASVTAQELCNAFLGEPSKEFLEMTTALIKYEYPDFEGALNNWEAIEAFFRNMGNLMPAAFREQLSSCAEDAADIELPANPSLCATEEQVEQFCDLRAEILGGRATEEQIAKLCERPVDDLKDLATALQKGPANLLADSLPPLVSDPGCDNGLLPYESDEQIAVTTAALNGLMEQLKVEFAYDMLGNGPGQANWGLVNMVLSDTMGNPYTTHTRKVDNRPNWIDFYVDPEDEDVDEDGNIPKIEKQRGAFPYKVAAWLQDYMDGKLSANFSSGNDYEDTVTYSKTYEDLGIRTFGGALEKRKLPNLGHNVSIRTDFENKKAKFLVNLRKKDPDMTLSFHDNLKGLHSDTSSVYAKGFDLEFYLSDLVEEKGVVHNASSDNVRIKIIENKNENAEFPTPALRAFTKTGSELRNKAYSKNDETFELSSELKFEFLAADNALDGIDLTDYPNFLNTFVLKQKYLPQIVLLHELIGSRTLTKDEVKDGYDEIISSIMGTFIDDVAGNDDAFLYGATYDDLSYDDAEYVIADEITNDDGETYEAGTNYYEVKITDEDGNTRKIKNRDQVLGISYMQHNVGEEDNRVIYLDPMTFGGSYMNPPLYIRPLKNKAWLGFVDVMFPDLSPCKPYRTDLIDFGDIQQRINDTYAETPEDERLKSDPDCVIEVPYNRILERASASGLEGLITAAIRIYVSAHFIQSMATFTKFNPSFPGVFSNIYAAYIVEEMKASFMGGNHPDRSGADPFKNIDFWYEFLEQAVQLYDRRYNKGEFDPPSSVIDACVRLNDMQESYRYAQKRGGDIKPLETLKHYRRRKNLDAIAETEDDAKIVLTELVIEQLNYMGEKFIKNLEIVDMEPSVYNLDHHLLQSLSQGGESLVLNQEIREEYAPVLPEEGDYYTTGAEFALSDGSEYIGYYHVDTDDDGNPLYITGAESGDDVEGEALFPMVNITTVPIGDIEEFGFSYDTSDTSKPFVIEKYISINGSPQAPSAAITEIKDAGDVGDSISDVYPGTLKLVTDRNGRAVGTDGELGVRHGLRFSVIIGDVKYTITDVEVDALDLKLSQIDPLEGDSKLLLCLINMLTADDKFKLAAQYVFPLRKITATMAIYNGLAFLDSIGEKVVPDGATYGSESSLETKPGVSAEAFDDGTATVMEDSADGAWAGAIDRNPGGLALGFKPWDKWDKVLLRNSKNRIKKIFKSYYNSRDFKAGKVDDSDISPGSMVTNAFKERFKAPVGQDLLPFWKQRMLRTNPFNASGELCEEKD